MEINCHQDWRKINSHPHIMPTIKSDVYIEKYAAFNWLCKAYTIICTFI